MLASITPLGERGRNSRWAVTMAAFVIGGVAGGAALGSALGAIANGTAAAFGWTVQERLAALAVVALGAVLLDALPVRLPTTHRQVDERWLHRYRGWVYGSGFGFQLGAGVVTIVVTAAVYATFAAAFLTASPVRGAVIGGAFGLSRAATAMGGAPVRSPRHLTSMAERLRRWDGPSRRVALAIEAGLAAAAVVAAAFAAKLSVPA